MKKRIKFLGLIFLTLFIVTCSKEGEGGETGKDDGSPTEETKGKEFDVNVSGSAVTITVPNAIMITVPQGAFEGKATFKVTPLQSSSLPKAEDFTLYEAFEVTSTSGSSFNKDLEITIKYDASQGEKEAGRNGVAYYDEKRKRWIPFTDVTVDEQKSEIKFKSNHLTKLGRYSIIRQLGYTDWRSSLHFYIYWNEAKVPDNATYISPYKTVNVGTDPHYVQDIERYLEEAYTAFKNAQLQLPSGKISVYLKDLGPGIDGNTSFMGSLYINESIQNSDYATTAEALPMVCAHELFHYIQDYYYMQLFSDYTTKWWLEATAVQADRFVWPTNKKFEVIEYAQNLYQNLPRSWDDCNSDPEYYIAGNFLAYLITYRSGTKLALPDIIKECGKATNISYIRTILDNEIKTKLGTSIGEEYVDFIKWAFKGESDIKLSPMPPTPTPIYPNFKNAILANKAQQENLKAEIPYLATCFFKGMNKTGEKLTLMAKIENKSDCIAAFAFKINKSGSPILQKEMNKKDSIEIDLADGDEWIDIVCINKNKDENGSVNVIFNFDNRPKITSISPQKAKAGEQVTINGTNLGTSTSSSIYINDQLLNLAKYLISWTNTLIQFKVPEDASTGDIYVKVNNVPSNKVAFQFVKERPIIELWGTRVKSPYFTGLYQPWGGTFNSNTITILGKNWVNDPAKTKVKVNGTVVAANFSYIYPEPPYSRRIDIDMPTNVLGNITLSVECEGLESDPVNFFVGIPISALQKLPIHSITNVINVSTTNGKNLFSFTLTRAYNQISSANWNGNTLTVIGDVGGWVGKHEMKYIFNEYGTEATLQAKINSINLDAEFTIENLKIGFKALGITGDALLSYQKRNLTPSDYLSLSGNVKTSQPVYVYPITGIAPSSNELYTDLSFDFNN
jgi:hypothetical protein